MSPHIPTDILTRPFAGRRKRQLKHQIMLVVGVLLLTGATIKLANPIHSASASHEKELKSLSAELLTAIERPLNMMKDGDEGYISLNDIQTHPLLNVYIGEDTRVYRHPTPERVIHITLADGIIVLDPVSVSKAIRYVAMGPVTEAQQHLMTSSVIDGLANGLPTLGSSITPHELAPQPTKEH